MSTMDDHDFDYQQYTRETGPDPALIQRGPSDRQHRFDTTMLRLSVRIDEAVLQQFRQLVPDGESCDH